MKQVVGAGGQQALGAAVMESKAFLKQGDAKPDVVFSAADLSVEPIELKPKKRPEADSQAMTEPDIKRKPTLIPEEPKKK
jgi:hypothetical protein